MELIWHMECTLSNTKAKNFCAVTLSARYKQMFLVFQSTQSTEKILVTMQGTMRHVCRPPEFRPSANIVTESKDKTKNTLGKKSTKILCMTDRPSGFNASLIQRLNRTMNKLQVQVLQLCVKGDRLDQSLELGQILCSPFLRSHYLHALDPHPFSLNGLSRANFHHKTCEKSPDSTDSGMHFHN